jgi:hypothetical protein
MTLKATRLAHRFSRSREADFKAGQTGASIACAADTLS